MNEILVFKEYTNVFEEFMFFTFFLKPMKAQQLERIMKDVLLDEFPNDNYIDKLAPNFANVVNNALKDYTSNLNEYKYIYLFLYPEYAKPLCNKKEQEVAILLANQYKLVMFMKPLMEQVISQMFMHSTSKEDLQQELKQYKEDKFVDKVQQKQQAAMQFGQLNFELFDYKKITHFENYRKNKNFNFMQSLILICSYIAGQNKETTDLKMFQKERSKKGGGKAKADKQNAFLMGKTKKFGMERVTSIIDCLLSLLA